MAKHIIFIGKRDSGKSLFAKMIFGTEKTMWINGSGNLLNNPFLFDHGKEWKIDNVVIDDLHPDFNIESFYNTICAPVLKINRQGRETITVTMPRFVFILKSDNRLPIDSPSFMRRFKVIDFDKHKISSLIKMIQTEKIIINTPR
ncbi:hypothetical protein [Chryseobacterium sp. MP_3.2]|uniref:hypothetical protein n=1 Tax=Chryseobacterium sp. MP_3.2 TaxID=3071712 RepID=UPI002E07F0AA|nr:hypothetical protein [Chryseobacterium sp. MP_3.2]